MRLAIDLDGCALDTHPGLRKMFGMIHGPAAEERRYDWGDAAAMRETWRLCADEQWLAKLKPFPGFLDVVQAAQQRGWGIDFVSNRDWTPPVWRGTYACLQAALDTERVEDYGDLWLLSHRDKVKILAEYPARHGEPPFDVLIEDNPMAIVAAYHRGIRPIIFDQPWNQGLDLGPRAARWTGEDSVHEALFGGGR